MKLYYLSKRKLIGIITGVLLVFCMLGLAIFQVNRIGVTATNIKEPVYQGNTDKKAVAITINVDWGEEYIPAMLEEFKKHNCSVTFFVTGKWAENNPELLKEMKAEGHSIQNHGYKHVHFCTLSAEDAKSQIKKAEDVIYNVCGEKTRFFASPYGEQNQTLLQVITELNYELIMWSVDTIDWQRPSPETIVKRVNNKVHNDAIILMHPTDPTLKALPDLLTYLQDNGYELLTIDRILINTDGKS